MFSEQQYTSLVRQGYNRIPLVSEVLVDMETPLSIYIKLCHAPYAYLFESIQGGERWGRYSIIGLPAKEIITVCGGDLKISRNGTVVSSRQCADPLAEITTIQQQFRIPEIAGMPRFTGGLVGYFAYDAIAYIEPSLKNNSKTDPLGTPDILLMVSEELIVFDNLQGKAFIIVHANPDNDRAYQDGLYRIKEIERHLLSPHTSPSVARQAERPICEKDFQSNFNRDHYAAAVEKIKKYIYEGDAMQVVLSRRFNIPFHSTAINLYRALRYLNPSPYMYYLDLDQFSIVGSSPEILARLEGGLITVRPMAGTRPRGKTPQEDMRLEGDLLSDPKELAEHLMLLDLGRNDIGRVAKMGSVSITDQMLVEYFSHVMHIVSNITGQLRADLSALDVLRASFPAGTLTGAPKIRAMEIIDELEPTKRGIYGGAIGYLDWHGNMDTAIAIRTAIIKNNSLHIQVGAGIVADSTPDNEWEETLNKGRAIFRAAAMAEDGLKPGLL